VVPPIALRAAPKSMSTGSPPGRTMMFSGLMSRCRKRPACTTASPSSSGAASFLSSASGGSGACCSRFFSGSPRS
jgi:hypothetical protein